MSWLCCWERARCALQGLAAHSTDSKSSEARPRRQAAWRWLQSSSPACCACCVGRCASCAQEFYWVCRAPWLQESARKVLTLKEVEPLIEAKYRQAGRAQLFWMQGRMQQARCSTGEASAGVVREAAAPDHVKRFLASSLPRQEHTTTDTTILPLQRAQGLHERSTDGRGGGAAA